MDLDPLLLSRVQFAFTIAFHILFPAFTIGLAAWIVVLEGLWLVSGRDLYRSLSEFWTRIFAVSFGMGVVSGIVMPYQFGTNWSRFALATGNILGPLLNFEVMTAFFLEATFLGILLFGRDRVSRRMHFLAALLVAIGTLMSAFWILAASSWMHTPAGFELRDGRYYATDWWVAIFNPSFPYRLLHMVTAAFLTTAFAVAGTSAYHLLGGRFGPQARTGLSWSLGLAAVLAPAQVLLGDLHGLNTLAYQPAKVAAMEGHWETRVGQPLILFALPDPATEANRWEVAIPKLGSLILTHDVEGEVKGLKAWPREERPYVPLVFWSFRLMVGIGLAMLAVAALGMALRMSGRLYDSDWFLRIVVAASPLGFVAILAGWVTTESGRQPWIIHGLMRTAEAASPSVGGGSTALSLGAFIVSYAVIFGAGLYYVLRLIRTGPRGPRPQVVGRGTPARPIAAADEPLETVRGR